MSDSLFKDLNFITIPKEFFLFNELIYIPSGFRADIFLENYEDITSEYQEIGKTLEKITRNYYFPAMKKYIEKRISECAVCNRNKILKHVFYKSFKSFKILIKS